MFVGQLDTDADGYLKTHNYFSPASRGLCLRRRAGPSVSSSHYRRRYRLHGRNRKWRSSSKNTVNKDRLVGAAFNYFGYLLQDTIGSS